MAGPDLPPITTEHSQEIIGDNWPEHSETDTVAATLSLFEKSAHSINAGDVADTMFALLEATAKGETPENLMAGFTADQREAFEEAMTALNRGQGASVAAQDILNTKVELNGVVETFEEAVQELIAEYSGTAATSPRSQQEFQEKYQNLLNQAKQQANQLGQNHKATQASLMNDIQNGASPTIPSTMAAGNGSQVPGMPSDAMGGLLQNLGGVMSKPPNLPMPDVQKAIQPAAAGFQQGLAALMQGGKPGGVDVSKDALSKLVSSTADSNARNPLSAPGGAKPAVHREQRDGGGQLRSPLSVSSADNQRPATVDNAPDDPLGLGDQEERQATLPTEPATTEAPQHGGPQVTLSSGAAVDAPSPLSPTGGTHLSSGEAGSGAAPLHGAGHGPTAAGGAPMGGGMGMMGPMMGPMGGAGAAPASADSGRKKPSATVKYDPRSQDHEVDSELRDFGYAMKGLEHATDKQMVAASVLAGVVRANRRAGIPTEAVVGVNNSGAVFATSDGLGFIPEGVRLASHVNPLINLVPDEFIVRWLGCDQPWRALLEAVGQRFVGPFDAIVATDPEAEPQGVTVLTGTQIDAVNIAAGNTDRWSFDAVHEADIADALAALTVVWGAPKLRPDDAFNEVIARRWRGDRNGDRAAIGAWARYLVAAAATASAQHKDKDASYLLRVALRVPELLGAGRD